MLKLYKRIKRVLHYHEAWADRSMITTHWGKVGERGETAVHKRNKKRRKGEDLERILSKPLSEDYKPIDVDDHAALLIEYTIDVWGSAADLNKRHALEDLMNETLGWTGLGHCDGGSIGSGSMEVCCLVVDFKTAKRVIKEDLKKTKFADYSRIYDGGAVEPRVGPDDGSMPPAEGSGMLVPPWLMCQGVGRKAAVWQSGKEAEYLAKWVAWFQNIPAEARAAYASIFDEPMGWAGFYKSSARMKKSK
jgi:hypothetical protein